MPSRVFTTAGMPVSPLHDAIAHTAWDRTRALLDEPEADAMLSTRNSKASTVLMAALHKRAPQDIVERMLLLPSIAKVAAMRARHRTAAMLAQELGQAELAARLRELELSVADAPGQVRCPVCRGKLTKFTALDSCQACVERGAEPNCLVIDFFGQRELVAKLQEIPLHSIADCHNCRQEVSETMALIQALEDIVGDLSARPLHFVDLCCGSSMTTAVLALTAAPGSCVTAVDIRPPLAMPHYEEAGLANVQYLQLDMMGGDFLPTLEARAEAVDLPVIVLGMHCCGALSIRAIQLFHRLTRSRGIVLCPCCYLTKLQIKRAATVMPDVPASLLSLADAADAGYYELWVQGLCGLLHSPTSFRATDMLTPKNAIITASMPSEQYVHEWKEQ